MSSEEYYDKSKVYLKKAEDHLNRKDYDSCVMMAHAALELVIKGYLLKKTKQLPLYLLQAFTLEKFSVITKKLFTEDEIDIISEINKKRNSIYHTIELANKENAELAIKAVKDTILKVENNNCTEI